MKSLHAVMLSAVAVFFLISGCSRQSTTTEDGRWFEDRTRESGLEFSFLSGHVDRPLLPEITGGGAALADLDGDGDLDIYLIQGGWHLAGESHQASPGNQLYINRGGYFEPVDGQGATDRGYGMGVASGDYDNDGDVDLYVTNVGSNVLLRNDGNFRFTNVAREAGVDDPGWGTAATFSDFDRDGDLDLYLVNYLHWTPQSEKSCVNRGEPTYCSPSAYDVPAMDRLYRNEGEGRFTDVSLEAGLSIYYGNGLGVVAADFNGDGLDDVFVANDRMKDQLWINRGSLRFSDQAEAWGSAVDNHGIAKAGMGVAVADMNHDGNEDLLVVNFETETDSLYRNEGNYFVDVTAVSGLAAESRRHTRFGVALADFDNDGVDDLLEVNGKVDGNPGVSPDPFREPNVLFKGIRDGDWLRFEKQSNWMGEAAVLTSRALAVGDINDDGLLDLLIVNRDGPVQLLVNDSDSGNWVSFRVLNSHGSAALGARVSLRVNGETRHRTVRSAYSYLAASDPRVYFGLGDAEQVSQVRVLWPNGREEHFGGYSAGSLVELTIGMGERPVGTP